MRTEELQKAIKAFDGQEARYKIAIYTRGGHKLLGHAQPYKGEQTLWINSTPDHKTEPTAISVENIDAIQLDGLL